MLDVLATAATSSPAPTGMGMDALLIGAVVAGTNALVEVVKTLAASLKKNGNGNGNGNGVSDSRGCVDCQGRVKSIHEVVCRVDANGTPMIYGGHLVAEKLDRVADELAEVSSRLSKEK